MIVQPFIHWSHGLFLKLCIFQLYDLYTIYLLEDRGNIKARGNVYSVVASIV